MPAIHVVAFALILGGVILEWTAHWSGPLLFAIGVLLETAGWLLVIWTGEKKKHESPRR